VLALRQATPKLRVSRPALPSSQPLKIPIYFIAVVLAAFDLQTEQRRDS
jgi:hypothetical protein